LPSRLALCPCSLGFALAACAMPSRLALRPCGLGFALAACATHYALAARASPLRLGFALVTYTTHLQLGLRQQRRWQRRQWKQRRQMLALAARATRLQAWASPLRLGFAHFALAARATHSWLGFAQTQQSNSKAAAAKAALAALPPICRSGSSWRQQHWQLR
jgi:hypothetical protein